MSLKLYFSFFMLGCIFPISLAQHLSFELEENITSRVEGGVSVGIAIAVIDSAGTHFYNYGVRSLESKEPVDEFSLFEIASITKTFTGILLADMTLKKEVNPDDDMQAYLPPGIKVPIRNGRSIKLLELANHTSSLPHSPGNLKPVNPEAPYADYTEDQLYDFINSYEPERDFGAEYQYSNYAVALLSHILAAKRGMTYEDLVVDVITRPLEMKNTRIKLSTEMEKNLTTGHRRGFETAHFDYGALEGSGGFYSTAEDMAHYLEANMGKSESSLHPAMRLSQKPTNQVSDKLEIGLVWAITHMDDIEIIFHNGNTPGFRSFIGFVKGGDKGVVVLSNSGEVINDIGFHILNPKRPLNTSPKHISFIMRKIIDNEGIEPAIETYRKFKKEAKEDYDFGEYELNSLGYYFLNKGEPEKAVRLFKLNIDAFPDSPNVYDSMGEALLSSDDKEGAVKSFKKSLELNPDNKNALAKLEKMGVDTSGLIKEVTVADEVLDKYVGKYQVMENYFVTITKGENSQLLARVSGQEAYPYSPRSETVFYSENVIITFNLNESGRVESLTINQAGNELTCKKIE